MEAGILVNWQLVVGDHRQKSLVDQLIIVWCFNGHVPRGLGPKREILLHPTQGTPQEVKYRTPSDLPTNISLFHLLYYLI